MRGAKGLAVGRCAKALPWLAGLLVLGGCASVPMSSQSLDTEAKQFAPEPGLANIYVSRGADVNSALVAHWVSVSEKCQGSLAPHTYLLFSVWPGRYVIHVLPGLGGEPLISASVTAQAGSNYFFHIRDRLGFTGHQIGFKQVEEPQARKWILKGRRALPEPF